MNNKNSPNNAGHINSPGVDPTPNNARRTGLRDVFRLFLGNARATQYTQRHTRNTCDATHRLIAS